MYMLLYICNTLLRMDSTVKTYEAEESVRNKTLEVTGCPKTLIKSSRVFFVS